MIMFLLYRICFDSQVKICRLLRINLFFLQQVHIFLYATRQLLMIYSIFMKKNIRDAPGNAFIEHEFLLFFLLGWLECLGERNYGSKLVYWSLYFWFHIKYYLLKEFWWILHWSRWESNLDFFQKIILLSIYFVIYLR